MPVAFGSRPRKIRTCRRIALCVDLTTMSDALACVFVELGRYGSSRPRGARERVAPPRDQRGADGGEAQTGAASPAPEGVTEQRRMSGRGPRSPRRCVRDLEGARGCKVAWHLRVACRPLAAARSATWSRGSQGGRCRTVCRSFSEQELRVESPRSGWTTAEDTCGQVQAVAWCHETAPKSVRRNRFQTLMKTLED